MNTETIVDNSLSTVLATVTQSLVEATKEYGPDAVELGLFVYRMEAARKLIIPIVMLVIVCVLLTKYVALVKRTDFGYRANEGKIVVTVIAGIVLLVISIGAAVHTFFYLLNPFYWVTVFGYPEVMVAYKALDAAGLM